MRHLFFLLLFIPPEKKEQLQKVAQTLTRGLPTTACPVSRAAPTARTTPPAWLRRMALSAWLFCPSSASACSPSSSAWSSSTTFAGTRYEQPPTSVSNSKTRPSLRAGVQICPKVKDFKVILRSPHSTSWVLPGRQWPSKLERKSHQRGGTGQLIQHRGPAVCSCSSSLFFSHLF